VNDVRVPPQYEARFDDFGLLDLTEIEEVIVRELIRRTTMTQYEYGAALNAEAALIDGNGNVQYFTSEKHDEITIPENVVKLLDDPCSLVTLLHCHTNNTLPSRKDFSYLLRAGVTRIVVACANRSVYTVQVGFGKKPNVAEYWEKVEKIGADVDRNAPQYTWYDGLSVPELIYMAAYEQAYQIKQEFKWDMKGGKIND
jgi:hypothetical protein